MKGGSKMGDFKRTRALMASMQDGNTHTEPEMPICVKCTRVWNPKAHPIRVNITDDETGWCPRCIAKKRLRFMEYRIHMHQTWAYIHVAMEQYDTAKQHAHLMEEMGESFEDLLLME